MVEQGYDPRVAQERVKAQGWQPVGIKKGPCGYLNRLVGTQGKLVFRETLGESAPGNPEYVFLGGPAALRCQ